MRKTPLLDFHLEINGSIGSFARWKMPMDYGNMLKEALETRNNVTFFDISHLSRIKVKGDDSEEFLQRLVARDIKKVKENFISGPTAFLNFNAGFKDDVMVYKFSKNDFLVVGNAVNHDKIIDWLHENIGEYKVTIEDLTFNTAMLAVQGPKSIEIMRKVLGDIIDSLTPLKFHTDIVTEHGVIKLLSYSGWTGETGFELITDIETGEKILRVLYEKGVRPAGLGARDILRIEMGYALYGNEISEDINPIEAKYWVFSWKKKDDYIGREALLNILGKGIEKVRYGFVAKKGSALPRKGMKVFVGNREIGFITSGTFSPILKLPIALGYVLSKYSINGLRVNIKGNKRIIDAKIVEPPFVKNL
ncbi:MAG: glycine cleavage system protein T [Thermofilum sp. ex4484_79]|nr:MAG: glycine cleavage system protein T [Thermofilum sp. ex4484_79]